MKLVVVPHGAKVVGVTRYAPALAADPPMTMEGKQKILTLIEPLMALGPYDAAYCSTMDRACGTMCTIVKQLGIDCFTCIAELGQRGNLDNDGTVIAYPGHESDGVIEWQQQGLHAVNLIHTKATQGGLAGGSVFGRLPTKTVLIVTHRPILAGLIAAAGGIFSTAEIQSILDDKGLVGKGYRIFTTEDGVNINLEE